MKLIAFIQMYNEAKKGNLVRCLDNCRQWADDIVIYDDASTDNSVEIAKRFTPHVIQGESNCFNEELFHKQSLLEYAMEELRPDWIMWIDCDEIMDRAATAGGLRELTETAPQDISAFYFKQVALWRSQTYARVDSLFATQLVGQPRLNNVPAGWFCRLWRGGATLHFDVQPGLHHRLYPINIEDAHWTPFHVIHYGFWNYKNTLEKIGAKPWTRETFTRLGYNNWILNETQCACIRVPDDVFPVENIPPDIWPEPRVMEDFTPYYEIADTHPLSMVAGKASSEVWRERHHDDYHGDYDAIHQRNATSYVKGSPTRRLCMFRFNPEGKDIVDIGCGGGWYALDCIANGAQKVFCLEINDHIIEHAKRSFVALEVPTGAYEFIHVPAEVHIPPKSIDIVYCMAVFMHIPLCEVRLYLSWISQILSSTGEAHLQFHQVDGTTLFRSDGVPDHGYRIPDNSVDAMIEEVGLTISEKRYPRGDKLEPVWTLYTCTQRKTGP